MIGGMNNDVWKVKDWIQFTLHVIIKTLHYCSYHVVRGRGGLWDVGKSSRNVSGCFFIIRKQTKIVATKISAAMPLN